MTVAKGGIAWRAETGCIAWCHYLLRISVYLKRHLGRTKKTGLTHDLISKDIARLLREMLQSQTKYHSNFPILCYP